MKVNFLKKFIEKILPILFWVFVWQIIFIIVNNSKLIPSPLSTFFSFKEVIFEYDFLSVIFLSTFRVLCAFILGMILGLSFAVLSKKFKVIYYLLNPILLGIRIIPVPSFILLLMVWLNPDFVTIVISFLMVFPLVFSNLFEGFDNVDHSLLEMAKVYNLSKKDIIKNIYVPSMMSSFFSSCKNGIGFAFKAGVSAEIMASLVSSVWHKIAESKINHHI